MTKKRFISVIIVLSVLTSILMLGVTSASAVSKPTLYAPANIKGGQRVTWSNAGASTARRGITCISACTTTTPKSRSGECTER